MGAFPPPAPAGASGCYISDPHRHRDGGQLGLKNKEDAKKFPRMVDDAGIRIDLRQRTSGLFSLAKTPVKVDDDLAARWSDGARPASRTIRNSYQILSRVRRIWKMSF